MNASYLGTSLTPNSSNLTPFDLSVSADAGLYLDSRANALEICQQLASSVGAYVVTDLAGKFKIFQLVIDNNAAADYSVTEQDMEEKTLQISQKLDVVGAIKLAYCKNWTVQDTGLALGLPTESAAILGKEWFYAISKDDASLVKFQQSSEVPQQDTLLITESSATTESTRQLAIKKVPRFIFTATYLSHMLLVELGDKVNIKYPRFDLSAGKTGVVVDIQRNWLSGRATIGVLI